MLEPVQPSIKIISIKLNKTKKRGNVERKQNAKQSDSREKGNVA